MPTKYPLTVHANVTQRPGGRLLIRLIAPGMSKPLWRCYAGTTEAEAVMRAYRHLQPPAEDTPHTGRIRLAWWGLLL